MSPEERELLERSVELAEDNNKVLHGIRRAMRLGRILRIVYWVIIIGTAIGAFYFLQPYIEGVGQAYGGAKDNFDLFMDIFGNN